MIVGAARGLGRAAAGALGRQGAELVLLDRLGEELEQTTAELTQAGVSVTPVVGDVAQTRDVRRLVEAADQVGPAEILANCAGVIRRMPIGELTLDDLDALWDVNVRGTVAVTQAFLPGMRERRRGKVINLGSLGSVTGLPRRTAYAATKGAVAQYTVSLACEVGADRICVNAIAPGYVSTAMTADLLADADRRQQLLDRIPLGRLAEPADLEGTFVFLASRASDYVTGQVLLVDGGWTST